MNLYIATPINARKGKDLKAKLIEAKHRIEHLKEILRADKRFKDYEFYSTFYFEDHLDKSEAENLGDCIKLVLTCDAIMLDHGWLQSKGCNLEYRAAKIYGKEIFEFDKL